MNESRQRMTHEIKKFRTEFIKTIATLIISAFSLIAALAWNSAITETLKKYYSPGNTMIS